MPSKPTKQGVKVWCLTNLVARYIFEIYCGANKGFLGIVGTKKGEAMQGKNVMHGLLCGLENRGHIVIMANFFSLVPLFMDLLNKCTYIMGTVRANHIGLPKSLATKSLHTKCIQGHLEWRMHQSKQVGAIGVG